ncbi:30S ribosomal protein S14 [Truepera radiovictrix]|uniref:Small ribosomal subunit protein uS14 n=1 Tax=Truepera radiovictrix (strain DSM 17093 / CIP 108686 / LMG 22925 / RQ-24) TaxID=649638 RepID=D7CSA0_TRURR|nr:30S ribosomal protein S14 [Truepera radiovictrix]ADI13632.1 ribosomal protein S14 [Truepera radiovictrix DSM 17093]WMT57806.1 30S ribosomal protein S14 [Truepera radiovictrix]
MARKSLIAKNRQRQRLAAKYADKRRALRAAGDYRGLGRLPRDASKVRVKNRCALTGRSRGYLRAFGVSRIALRELAHAGLLPGVKKASW